MAATGLAGAGLAAGATTLAAGGTTGLAGATPGLAAGATAGLDAGATTADGLVAGLAAGSDAATNGFGAAAGWGRGRRMVVGLPDEDEVGLLADEDEVGLLGAADAAWWALGGTSPSSSDMSNDSSLSSSDRTTAVFTRCSRGVLPREVKGTGRKEMEDQGQEENGKEEKGQGRFTTRQPWPPTLRWLQPRPSPQAQSRHHHPHHHRALRSRRPTRHRGG